MGRKTDSKNLETLNKEIEEWKNKYLRALADYQNLEKRIQSERVNEIRFATKSLVVKLLPVIDVLEKAQEVLNDQGLTLALKQFSDVLRSEQVEKIEVLGKKFDPYLMECVEAVECDSQKENIVLEEITTGYLMHGKVIRIAQVKVGKKNINLQEEELAKKELQKGDYM